MWEPIITKVECADPVESKRWQEQLEVMTRNLKWLLAHWDELLSQSLGKFVAIAGEEPFIADTAAEAAELAMKTHPDEKWMVVRLISQTRVFRLYGSSIRFPPELRLPVPTLSFGLSPNTSES